MQAQTQATFTRKMQTQGTQDTQAQLNSFFQDGGQVTLRLVAFVLAFALSRARVTQTQMQMQAQTQGKIRVN